MKDETVGKHRQSSHENRRDDQCQQKSEQRHVSCEMKTGPGQHGPKHEKLSMGDIDNAHHPKYQGKSQGNQGQNKSGYRAVKKCQEDQRKIVVNPGRH